MALFRIRTTAIVVACIALASVPSFAQRGDRRGDTNGGRRERVQPGEQRDRVDSRQRARGEGREESRERGGPPARVEIRRRPAPGRRIVISPRAYAQPYRYRPFAQPYGYRPYGYRPGWSLDLYFGRPYGGYDYPRGEYGYYGVVPGRGYGAVRIVDAPRDAQVYVDDYFAGVVDDYDGVFQHLNLEAGTHHIEIEAEGYPIDAFDVRVAPGQTVTYHAGDR